MLVLSRKIDEVITIGDNITVTVVDIQHDRGGRVRLGITAPKDVLIMRPEVLQNGKDRKVPVSSSDHRPTVVGREPQKP